MGHLKVHGAEVTGVAILGGGLGQTHPTYAVSCSEDTNICITDVVAGYVSVTFRGSCGPLSALSVAADQVRMSRCCPSAAAIARVVC